MKKEKLGFLGHSATVKKEKIKDSTVPTAVDWFKAATENIIFISNLTLCASTLARVHARTHTRARKYANIKLLFHRKERRTIGKKSKNFINQEITNEAVQRFIASPAKHRMLYNCTNMRYWISSLCLMEGNYSNFISGSRIETL